MNIWTYIIINFEGIKWLIKDWQFDLAGALSISMLTGCSRCKEDSGNSKQESNSKGKEVKNYITQLVEHPALDATRTGFVKH